MRKYFNPFCKKQKISCSHYIGCSDLIEPLQTMLINRIKKLKGKRNIRLFMGLLMIMVSMLPYFAMAQDPGPCPDCPVDGGLSLLLAGGVAYGMKKYRAGRKGG